MNTKIAIIPARGGSKRIPRKNIKDFLGKPIIAYAIEAALRSELFDDVIVSTDDAEIASIAQQYGASVPFMRSAENATDHATTVDVLVEVIQKTSPPSPLSKGEGGQTPENNYPSPMKRGLGAVRRIGEVAGATWACIYPTAPFVTPALLQKAYQQMQEGGFDSIYPVQQFSFPVQRAVIFEQEKLQWLHPEHAMTRSQDLVPTYHDAGQFYFFKPEILLEKKTILTPNTTALIISEMEAQDIDNESDWALAELKYRLLYEKL